MDKEDSNNVAPAAPDEAETHDATENTNSQPSPCKPNDNTDHSPAKQDSHADSESKCGNAPSSEQNNDTIHGNHSNVEENQSLLRKDDNHDNSETQGTTKNQPIHETVIVLCDDQSPKCHKHHRTSDKCFPKTVRSCVRKNECVVLCVGSLTFLFGCLALAVAVYMMKIGGKCQNDGDVSRHTNSSYMTSQKNITTLVPDLLYRGPGMGISYNVTVISGPESNVTQQDSEEDMKPVNLAAGREAFQSSTLQDQDSDYPATLAVDNSLDYLFSKGSCSRTNNEEQPYWYVDFGGLELVKKVVLMIPRDLPVGELHNFEVRIGQEKELKLNPVCRYYLGTALISTINLICERPMYGRYLSIEMLGDETRPLNRLTLCEVMVFNG